LKLKKDLYRIKFHFSSIESFLPLSDPKP